MDAIECLASLHHFATPRRTYSDEISVEAELLKRGVTGFERQRVDFSSH
jgi:hypothetical protein